MQQIPTASLPDCDNPAPEPAPEPAAGGPEGSAHDWSLAALLERAVHIAREVAIGDTGIAPVLIALRPGQPPLALFIESDEDPASADCLAVAIAAFLAGARATAWLRIDEEAPVCAAGPVCTAGGVRPAGLVCTAGLVTGRSTETNHGRLHLRLQRDAEGVITGLEPQSEMAGQVR